MIKKTITYTDYEGNSRTEDHYFNLSRAEIIEMDLSRTGGLQKLVEKIVSEQDTKKLIELLKEMIVASYGEKSPDGKRFIKKPELTESFLQSEAYSELLVEFFTNPDSAAAFFAGVAPKVDPAEVKKFADRYPKDHPINETAYKMLQNAND